MDAQKKWKMQAPAGVCDATIDGHNYEIDAKGQIEVRNSTHLETLKQHGFTDVVETQETADDIKAMDREALEEFIEERGGTVPKEIKMKPLRALALRTGGYVAEAEEIVPLDTGEPEGKKGKKKGKK